jgi:hypothetical protein
MRQCVLFSDKTVRLKGRSFWRLDAIARTAGNGWV